MFPDQIPPYRRLAALVLVLWSLIALLSLVWNLRNHARTLEDVARAAARSNYEKEVAYRAWVTAVGGVYVPVTAGLAPNPYLASIPDRDVVTTTGKALTLVNPAYMNRQVHEIQKLKTGLRSHLTGLTPLRPQNAPDPWEKRVLERFQEGETEVSEVQVMDGLEYMRLMKPIITEEPCLKCHFEQGLKIGEPAGGLSLAVPMAPVRAAAAGSHFSIWTWHVVTWLLGLTGILLYTARLDRYGRLQVQAGIRIRQSLKEKEVLLREIHHRVKNNLQVVYGILELQASVIPDGGAKNALRDSRNRIRTMALIHERLYRSEDLALIDLARYIDSLARDLYTAYGLDPRRVALSLALEPVIVNVETAIPCGLIANELLVNAMKYAFPQEVEGAAPPGAETEGEIRVSLAPEGDDGIRLVVSDTGGGFPEGFDFRQSPSMGLRLVESLVIQMGGRLDVSRITGKGAAFTVHLPFQGPSTQEIV